jgi:two-component system, OmpR family, phosphate regulon sensor histidine kinase PhoR
VASGTSATPTRWKRRLVLQFLGPTLAALAGVLLTAVPYIALTLERHQVDTLDERLLSEARVLGDALPWSSGVDLDAACARLAADLGTRITVIAPNGRVLGESTQPASLLENHADRPEVRDALALGSGHSIRPSATVHIRLLYVAWRQDKNGQVRVVRTSFPLTSVTESVGHLRRLILLGILVAAFLGLIAALILSRRLLRRIDRLVTFARLIAAGEPSPYLAPERSDDLGILEAQLSDMAHSVKATIGELRVEQERMEAILRGMVEGVLVTDLTGIVVLLNARARELLGIGEGPDGRGRPLLELTRDPAFQELARELRHGASIITQDVTLDGGNGRTLQVNAARLSGADGKPFGFVLVLHDVTELRRLEVVRRDFVANVSHELRTPLTAIKGYAETLLGPAGNDRETARRFLAVIDRHSERLGRLTEDLLTLSDLELGRTSLRVAPLELPAAIDDVLQILAERALRAGVSISSDIAPGTPGVLADGDRLRQVLINLVDNAIKYTPAGGRVLVRAAAADSNRHPESVEIAITDTGIGIPPQDLPRLTERFFRVDKARSRALGGTGLGLAIVKHIVQAHGGWLDISSRVGQGTTVHVGFPAVGGNGTP